jgi:hypothetical protein
MSDSMGASQDGATNETVTKDRFDGLMSAYQKAQSDNAALKERLTRLEQSGADQSDAGAQDQSDSTGDSQQTEDDWEAGDDDIDFFGADEPTPRMHNERREFRTQRYDTDQPRPTKPTQETWTIS